MARYEHLPIFRDSFDLAVHIEKIVRNFSRYHKYTLGTELRNQSRHIMEQVISANNADKEQRPNTLIELREKLEQLKVLVRLCHQSGGFNSTKAYLYVSECVVTIAKQNEGWLRSYNDGALEEKAKSGAGPHHPKRQRRSRRKQPNKSGEAASGQNSLF